jgi:hypothetical protein
MARASRQAQRMQSLPDSDAFLGVLRWRDLRGQFFGSQHCSLVFRLPDLAPIFTTGAGWEGVQYLISQRN